MWRAVALAAVLMFSAAINPAAAKIISARYSDPTPRYDHGILGDAIEYGALILKLENGRSIKITLPQTRVFEDISPRLVDLDGDANPEVIAIETSLSKGASLAVYGAAGKIAQTPYLGRPHRWLAPVGAADLDGDGRIEIAFVEKPHLTKILRIWRLENGKLRFVTSRADLSNHQIGWNFIAGGIRTCAGSPEIITANGNWTKVMATRLVGTSLKSRAIAPYSGVSSLKSALSCKN